MRLLSETFGCCYDLRFANEKYRSLGRVSLSFLAGNMMNYLSSLYGRK